jgi:serine/threonine protein kinase
MSEVLKKFGRYYLLDLIAQGGMAEIYRARPGSVDGGRRLLVIKRIQAGFGGNNEFQKMFESEIKVTMGFNHPNIVQLYDFGEEQKQPYIAMELVDGKNIRQFLNRFKDMKQTFPVEAVAFMMEQAAAGLHYAHTFKDKISGESLNIVHRDISPQNILIAYEGTVKIIDFGIAKATTNSENTRAGVIKGKPSYLAPEQISGETLDGRTDQFALGAVFWEILVGKKLFQGDNDLAVLKMIESCTSIVKAPSLLNPNVPKELDKIVMKMLSKQPNLRFNSCEELSKALRRFLITYAPDFSTSDLSQLSKEIFKSEIVDDRKRVQQLNEKVEKILVSGGKGDDFSEEPKQKPKKKKKGETETFLTGRSKTIEYEVDADKMNQAILVERPARPPGAPPPHSRPAQHTTKTGASVTGVKSSSMSNSPFPNPAYNGTRSTMYQPAGSQSMEEGQKTSPFVAFAALLAFALGVSYYGPQFGFEVPFVSQMLGAAPSFHDPNGSMTDPGNPVRNPAQTEPVKPVTPEMNAPVEDPVSVKKARVKFNIFPSSSDAVVTLNGRRWMEGQPLPEVSVDAPLDLLVEKPGFVPFKGEFKIDLSSLDIEGKFEKEVILAPLPMREPAAIQVKDDNFGFLSVFSTPSAEVTIYVNDKPVGVRNSPFQKIKVPAGRIKLYLYNSTTDVESQAEFSLEKGSFKNVSNLTFKQKRR